jgi:Na+-transporting methylmalonyl-CoA/oxaloacetate decarboxylase gamma subunit
MEATMVQNLSNSLLITVIGMGLVFATILLLWGLMALIALIPDGKDAEEAAPVESPALETASVEMEQVDLRESGLKQQAAAAAVAFALASEQEKKKNRIQVAPLIPYVSAWQAFHRTNLIGTKQSKGHVR